MCLVVRSIVGDEHFERVVGLSKRRTDTSPEPLGAIERGDRDGEERLHAGVLVIWHGDFGSSFDSHDNGEAPGCKMGAIGGASVISVPLRAWTMHLAGRTPFRRLAERDGGRARSARRGSLQDLPRAANGKAYRVEQVAPVHNPEGDEIDCERQERPGQPSDHGLPYPVRDKPAQRRSCHRAEGRWHGGWG